MTAPIGSVFNPYLPDPRILTSLGMPASPQAQAQMAKPSLWNRLQEAFAPAPTEYGDLVGEKDVKSARNQALLQAGAAMLQGSSQGTNFAQILGGGVQAGMGGYRNAIDQKVQGAAQRQGIDLNRMKMDSFKSDQARLAGVTAARKQIFEELGAPPQGDPNAMRKWIEQAYPRLLAAGDTEALSGMSEMYKSLGNQSKRKTSSVNLGDRTQIIDDETGAVIREERNGQGPGTLRIATEMTPVQQERLWNTTIGQFGTQSKPYAVAHEGWSQVQQVAKRAAAGNPTKDDIIQLIDGMSRLNNPGAVVRSSTVQMTMQKIGSKMDKLRMMLDHGFNGAWPKDIVLDVVRGARLIAEEHEKQYKRLRAAAKARGEHIGLADEYTEASLPNTWQDGVAGGEAEPDLSQYHFGGGE